MEKNELLPCQFCGSAGYVTKNRNMAAVAGKDKYSD